MEGPLKGYYVFHPMQPRRNREQTQWAMSASPPNITDGKRARARQSSHEVVGILGDGCILRVEQPCQFDSHVVHT